LKISRPGIGKLVYISRPFNHDNREPQELQHRERDYHPCFCRYTSQSLGVKGEKPGNPGYVKDGWNNAVKTAIEI